MINVFVRYIVLIIKYSIILYHLNVFYRKDGFMKKTDYSTENLYITVAEAAEKFFCGRITEAALYRLAREGQLPTIKVGRRILIDAHKMEAMYAL